MSGHKIVDGLKEAVRHASGEDVGARTRSVMILSIQARISLDDLNMVDQAADQIGLSRSAFLRQAALREARQLFVPPKIVKTK